ncbi:MAG: hypothetical protein RLZZ127_1033 [Planctomycetota bacterium]|jgi:hypothetical protein
MILLRVSILALACSLLLGAENDPAAAVAAARAALAAGAPERVALAAGADAGARARLARLATAVQGGRFDLTVREQRVDGDCAAVVVEGARPRGGRPDVFGLYLVREDGAWRLLPDPTRPAAADPARSARLAALGEWAGERIRIEPVVLAADGLATWMLGSATVAGRPVRPGAPIGLGQRIAVAPGKPGRLVFNRLDGSSISCAAGTVLTIVEEAVAGGTDLVIDLEEGAVQVDVHARAAYAHVRVRGLVSDVSVVGTIFLVQRVANDREYVAQVDGSVRVRPKGGGTEVALTGRQGVAVTGTELDPVDLLLTRPQLTPELLAQGDLRSQGLRPDPGGGGWDRDPIRDQAPAATAVSKAAVAEDAATTAETDDAPAPPPARTAAADGSSTPSTSTATSQGSAQAANQIGVASPGLGGARATGGITTTPAAAGGGSAGGSAGGTSPGASPIPLSGHPGFPSP